MISRFKFGHNYVFKEYHYDTGASFGTAKPLEEIEKSPFTTMKEDGILEYLNKFGKEYDVFEEMYKQA